MPTENQYTPSSSESSSLKPAHNQEPARDSALMLLSWRGCEVCRNQTGLFLLSENALCFCVSRDFLKSKPYYSTGLLIGLALGPRRMSNRLGLGSGRDRGNWNSAGDVSHQ